MTMVDGSGEGAGMRAVSRAFTGAPGRDAGVLPRTVDQRVMAVIADLDDPVSKDSIATMLGLRGWSISRWELDHVVSRLEVNERIRLVLPARGGVARFEVRR